MQKFTFQRHRDSYRFFLNGELVGYMYPAYTDSFKGYVVMEIGERGNSRLTDGNYYHRRIDALRFAVKFWTS